MRLPRGVAFAYFAEAAALMNDWNIQARAHVCRTCARPFADKQKYHTLLFDLKSEVQRQDLCESCWKADDGEAARHRQGFLSHWQGVYESPPPPAEIIQKENAESLLRKIVESNEPKYAAASYILAVMLERKRLLKVKEQIQREGQRLFIYENPKTGDVLTIPDPRLQLDQLDAVQRDVAALLEHGFDPPAEDQQPGSAETTAEAPAPAPDKADRASAPQTESLVR
jgi:hypothetical protein